LGFKGKTPYPLLTLLFDSFSLSFKEKAPKEPYKVKPQPSRNKCSLPYTKVNNWV